MIALYSKKEAGWEMNKRIANQQLDSVRRVLAINDLSGHSHTSLMAVIPIMSRFGIAVTALPTAILSSNTEHGGFVLADMTPHLNSFISHWATMKLSFTAIYSGFLGSEQQVEIVLRAMETFGKKQTLVVVDPVMADNGKLYPCFNKSIIQSMQRLVAHADLITPNLTEAAFLLGEPFKQNLSFREAKTWCRRLAGLGPRMVLITNVALQKESGRTSVIAYDSWSDSFKRSVCSYLPVNYPGTGDIFTSVLTALLLNDTELFDAVSRTVRFVSKAMKITIQAGTPPNDGIALEQALAFLPRL